MKVRVEHLAVIETVIEVKDIHKRIISASGDEQELTEWFENLAKDIETIMDEKYDVPKADLMSATYDNWCPITLIEW